MKQLKLLVADDEDIIRKGIAKYIILHTERFIVYEAKNGQEAIDLLVKYQPDIMLLDVQMPLKDGIEVMQAAKNAGLDPVIIILSGYDEFKYAQQAIRYGAKEYLLKPLRASDILECLDKMISILELWKMIIPQMKQNSPIILSRQLKNILLNTVQRIFRWQMW